MISLDQSQSLAEFQETGAETLDRLDQTGDGQLLTVNGKPRAVLLSLSAFEELEREALLSADVEAIRQSGRDIAEGKFMEAGEFFKQLHAEAVKLQARESKGQGE